MRTNLIRTMAIVVLASSIPAFSQAVNTKSNDPVTTCSNTQPNVPSQEATDPAESNASLELEQLQQEVEQLKSDDSVIQKEQQKANQEEQQQIRQDDAQWNHALMGIFGG
jgi:hypothetical protein